MPDVAQLLKIAARFEESRQSQIVEAQRQIEAARADATRALDESRVEQLEHRKSRSLRETDVEQLEPSKVEEEKRDELREKASKREAPNAEVPGSKSEAPGVPK